MKIIGSWVSGTNNAKENGTQRALIVFAHGTVKTLSFSAPIELTSVTYGGQKMTKIAEKYEFDITLSEGVYTCAYVLDENGILAATNTKIYPKWSMSMSDMMYESVFLSNADQTALLGQTSSSSTSYSRTLSTSALSSLKNDMAFLAGTNAAAGSYTVNNGFTQTVDIVDLTADGVVGYKISTGDIITPSITHTTSQSQSMIAFVVKSMQ